MWIWAKLDRLWRPRPVPVSGVPTAVRAWATEELLEEGLQGKLDELIRILNARMKALEGELADITTRSPHAATWLPVQAEEEMTLSTSGTTTDSTATLLPANALIDCVTARIVTAIGTATDWKLGDSTTADRFTAANSTLTAGTTDVGLRQWRGSVSTDAAGPTQTSAATLRITTTGTPSAGVIRVTVFARVATPAQS